MDAETDLSPLFYFDRVRVNFKVAVEDVVASFNGNQLHELLGMEQKHPCPLRATNNDKQRYGFLTTLDVTATSNKAISILSDLGHTLDEVYGGAPYKISYLELAKDIPFESKDEAVKYTDATCKGKFLNWMMLKDNNSYQFDPYKCNFNPYLKSGEFLVTSSTHYSGGKSMSFAGYTRISKAMVMPCCHMEFRLRGAKNIETKTGIAKLQDLNEFDIEFVYERIIEKYVRRYDSNMMKLGKWILGIMNLTRLGPKKERHVLMQAGLFCAHYKIKDYFDLRLHFENTKTEINKRYAGRAGSKKRIHKKYLDAKSHWFKGLAC